MGLKLTFMSCENLLELDRRGQNEEKQCWKKIIWRMYCTIHTTSLLSKLRFTCQQGRCTGEYVCHVHESFLLLLVWTLSTTSTKYRRQKAGNVATIAEFSRLSSYSFGSLCFVLFFVFFCFFFVFLLFLYIILLLFQIFLYKSLFFLFSMYFLRFVFV